MNRLRHAIWMLVLPVLMFATAANSQSLIEKSLVAKSKLHNSVWLKHDPASKLQVDHGSWDTFLKRYTRLDGSGVRMVSYSNVSNEDKRALRSYLAYLQSVDVARLNRSEQFAFWMNLYNASIVNVVLKNLPLKSILDVKSNPLDLKGPFNDTVAEIYGFKLTPDNIESGIVRPIWNDARLHYGFNCAAVSCPNLYPEAFSGERIDAQLDAAARAFINNPRGLRFESGKLVASKIFFWYSEDYGSTDASILKHVSRYASPELASTLSGVSKIARYEYDWALNGR